MMRQIREAVIQVSAGTGPVEVRRFVRLLADRIAARCRDGDIDVLDARVNGDTAAPSSVALRVRGDLSLIEVERGTHALVARSDERGRAARKRWFAGVTITEAAGAAGDIADIDVDERDLRVTATRAGGPGGQNVNKVSSAVRVVHAPSGIAVRVAEERSQHANRRRAAERIREALGARVAESARAASSDQRRQHYRVERGAPVRVYRLDRRGALVEVA